MNPLLTQAASTAIIAKSVGGGSSPRPAKIQPLNITESIAQKPFQWLIVAGTVIYFGGKFIKNAIPSGVNLRKDEAETATSSDNPWSAITFLNQPNIPLTTKFLKADAAYKEAKKIYDALNTYFADDADIVVGVFAALPSKVQVAQVVKSFEAYYKRNILEYLKNGKKTFDFGTGGISDALYNRIIENVKRKPKF
jgi:hypothetical protein